MKNRKQRRRAMPFTLIEVVVVIVILVTLAGIATPLYMKNIEKANIGAAKTQLGLIEDALDQYNIDVGVYPSDLQGLIQNIDESERWHGPYFKKSAIPKDPWGRDYIYAYPGEHNPESYDLYSLGKDNQEGGEGENADIINWATDEERYQ